MYQFTNSGRFGAGYRQSDFVAKWTELNPHGTKPDPCGNKIRPGMYNKLVYQTQAFDIYVYAYIYIYIYISFCIYTYVFAYSYFLYF